VGSNTVRLTANTAGGLGNIDCLDIEMSGTAPPTATGARRMDKLGRGVVAVRSSNTSVLVSWRLLGLDPAGIGFDVYRSTGGGAEAKLRSGVLTGATNHTDSTASLAQSNHLPVAAGDQWRGAGGERGVHADREPRGPAGYPRRLRAGGAVKFVWVGDLDCDGEYDYVLDRQTSPQTIEAYRSNGQFLWSVNMGPDSTNQNNIERGSSTVNVGHNDGVTVYDSDSDGRAEVAVRIANGVTFGNGQKFTNSDNNRQFIAILDGRRGAPRATAAVATNYLADGPMYARFGVGHLDGVSPSLVAYMKNRIGKGDLPDVHRVEVHRHAHRRRAAPDRGPAPGNPRPGVVGAHAGPGLQHGAGGPGR
jgi:rhamnogalacturonan endolyase